MGCILSKHKRDSRSYWLKKVKKNGLKLVDAPIEMRGSRRIVKAAVERFPYALVLASDELRSSKDIVIGAVKQNGLSLRYASNDMKSNVDVVMEAVRQDGRALEYASDDLRCVKEVVLAAVRQNPTSIKYALGGLNQDRDCLVMAGLFDDKYDRLSNANATRAVMSTKFSLGENTSDYSTKVALLIKKHPYFKKIIVYFPNSWSKNTCDPEWTNIRHPCRGTFDTCGKPAWLKISVPKENQSCWRYSFRYQLEKAKETGGFMIQVAEYSREEERHMLGRGQQIETEMAEQVGLKIFRIYQNPVYPFDSVQDTVEGFAKCLKGWYDGRCEDRSLTVCTS